MSRTDANIRKFHLYLSLLNFAEQMRDEQIWYQRNVKRNKEFDLPRIDPLDPEFTDVLYA